MHATCKLSLLTDPSSTKADKRKVATIACTIFQIAPPVDSTFPTSE